MGFQPEIYAIRSDSKETTALDGVTSTTTSSTITLSGYSRISVQVIATAISSGNGVFIVEVSNDDSNWKQLQSLITNVTAQTAAASVTLSANGNELMFLDPELRFKYMRVKVTRTTDGTYSAKVFTQL